jgi:murein DD-endopeptidase MepM/ murein hydrolase activator NlpD
VRLRPTLLACAAILVALSSPGTALAGSGGGVAAPTDGGGTAAEGGGTAYGTPVPAANRQERIEARRRRAARRRAARRRAQRRRAATPPAPPVLPAGEHVFPVAGVYSLGGEGSRFGAPRSGHIHMGQDISAARGTPVVAPYAGVVDWVRFQRGGAGHYVVLDADDEHDYVFMHLRRGSIPVVEGQRVAAGEQLGEVGNSGRSSGAHLHFELWVGGWYEKGGEAIDPLPLLEDWAG